MSASSIFPRRKDRFRSMLRLPLSDEPVSSISGRSRLRTNTGGIVPLSELLTIEQTVQDKAIYHKNQKPVVYVVADVGGAGAEQAESPVYGVLGVGKKLEDYRLPEGYAHRAILCLTALVGRQDCDEMGWGVAYYL